MSVLDAIIGPVPSPAPLSNGTDCSPLGLWSFVVGDSGAIGLFIFLFGGGGVWWAIHRRHSSSRGEQAPQANGNVPTTAKARAENLILSLSSVKQRIVEIQEVGDRMGRILWPAIVEFLLGEPVEQWNDQKARLVAILNCVNLELTDALVREVAQQELKTRLCSFSRDVTRLLQVGVDTGPAPNIVVTDAAETGDLRIIAVEIDAYLGSLGK